jgi:hypothetical protein
MKTLISEIPLTLAGQEFTLRPSLKAASAINRQFGGLANAYAALGQSDLAGMTFIIRNGVVSGELKNISTDDLNEMVWLTGTARLIQPLGRYITLLQNGGRDPDEADDGDDDAGQEGNGEI